MRVTSLVFTIIMLLLAGSGCTITAADLEDALDAPKVNEQVKSVFAGAISEVTLQVVTEAIAVAQEITAAVNAPASLMTQTEAEQTVTINKTVSKEGGGQIVISGTITGTGTKASGSVTIDLQAVWTDLPVEGGTQTTSGSQTLKGTMSWDSTLAEDEAFTLNVDVIGSFSLDGNSYAYDVNVTMDGGKFALSGTINGQAVEATESVISPTKTAQSGPITACLFESVPQECPPEYEGTCDTSTRSFCTEYTDARWTPTKIDEQCSWAKSRPAACPTEGLLGRCKKTQDGLAITYYTYSTEDTTEQDCLEEGGTWEGVK